MSYTTGGVPNNSGPWRQRERRGAHAHAEPLRQVCRAAQRLRMPRVAQGRGFSFGGKVPSSRGSPKAQNLMRLPLPPLPLPPLPLVLALHTRIYNFCLRLPRTKINGQSTNTSTIAPAGDAQRQICFVQQSCVVHTNSIP